jgi:hypothetical protein
MSTSAKYTIRAELLSSPSLLADLTPIWSNEPLDTGDQCWCNGEWYRDSYSSFRKDWCFCSGQERTPGQIHRRKHPFPAHGLEASGRYQG